LPGAAQVLDCACKELATMPAGICDLAHLCRQVADSQPLVAVLVPPGRKELDYPLTLGVPFLYLSNASYRVLTTQRHQGIAYPDPPLLEAPQCKAGLSTRIIRVLPSPSPNRQGGGQKVRTLGGNLL
jgi:hypothetical protein